MFGSLKKRLKEAVEKVSKSITKEDVKEEPKEAKEAKQEQLDSAMTSEKENAVPVAKALEKDERSAPDADTAFEQELDERIEELRELKEKVQEERLPPEIAESRAETEVVAKEEKRSFLSKITEKNLTDSEIEKIMNELNIALLENDVAVEVADRISEDVKKELVGASVKRSKVDDTIKDALKHAMLDVMKQDKIDIDKMINEKKGPFTIMFVGFNGVGKTSSLAKLAYKLGKYKPILAAADTFRAASIEQLEEHGRRLNMRVVKHSYGADAAAVIFDAKKHAEASGSKLVMADTAGRSHSNVNLMDELKKVARVNQPDLKILVLDSVTGNDIYDQCKLFNDAVGVDAIILTKADVYERGGAALSAAYTLKKPILYIGVGQEYEDLKEFKPEEIVKNLL